MESPRKSAAGLAYLIMRLCSVLEDPLPLPMILLQAKEDPFLGPIACLPGAPGLAGLWRRVGFVGRRAGIVLVATAASLQLRDPAANHDTLRDPQFEADG